MFYKLFEGDCFTGLKNVKDKSIDLVLTDPPYDIKWKQQIELHGRKAFGHNFEELKAWDNKIPIEELYDQLFPELDRVTKSNGSIIMFCRNEYITRVIDAGRKNNFDIKASIFFHKSNPAPQIRKKNYLSSIETAVWLGRWNDEKCDFTFNFINQKEMHNCWETQICSGGERQGYVTDNGGTHPTQKNLSDIEKLMRIHSNEGDTILDAFLGSGTTLVAARKLRRNCIGFEIDHRYTEFCKTRMNWGNSFLGDDKYEFFKLNDEGNPE